MSSIFQEIMNNIRAHCKQESPLHTTRCCLRTMTKLLFREKNWVLRNVMKRGVHTIFCRLQFSQMCVATENTTKFFEFVKRPPTLVKAFREKVFRKTLMNHDESLSTHYLCFIAVLSFVRHSWLFVNSV